MRILIVEDDSRIAQHLLRGLTESGHVVDHVADGPTGLAMALENVFDILIVDRLLPGMDGLALMAELRRAGSAMPILMLSAVASASDRVAGLRSGADDYLAKPYAFAEVLARLESLMRRMEPSRSSLRLQIGDLVLDLEQYQARRGGRPIALQRREFVLLEILMRHSDKVVTRTMLIEAGWPYDFDPIGNIVDTHIHRLRRKIDAAGEVPLIRTVAGIGYMLQTPGVSE